MKPSYTVSELTQKLRPFFEQQGVRLAILFGSTVSGKTHSKSDLDLAILAGGPLDTVMVTAELIHLLHLNQIDVVDLRQANPLLAREIVRQGILLYEQNPGGFAQFISLTIRRYIDTEKLREAQREVVERFLQARGIR